MSTDDQAGGTKFFDDGDAPTNQTATATSITQVGMPAATYTATNPNDNPNDTDSYNNLPVYADGDVYERLCWTVSGITSTPGENGTFRGNATVKLLVTECRPLVFKGLLPTAQFTGDPMSVENGGQPDTGDNAAITGGTPNTNLFPNPATPALPPGWHEGHRDGEVPGVDGDDHMEYVLGYNADRAPSADIVVPVTCPPECTDFTVDMAPGADRIRIDDFLGQNGTPGVEDGLANSFMAFDGDYVAGDDPELTIAAAPATTAAGGTITYGTGDEFFQYVMPPAAVNNPAAGSDSFTVTIEDFDGATVDCTVTVNWPALPTDQIDIQKTVIDENGDVVVGPDPLLAGWLITLTPASTNPSICNPITVSPGATDDSGQLTFNNLYAQNRGQTYGPDTDGDGYGEPVASTATVCAYDVTETPMDPYTPSTPGSTDASNAIQDNVTPALDATTGLYTFVNSERSPVEFVNTAPPPPIVDVTIEKTVLDVNGDPVPSEEDGWVFMISTTDPGCSTDVPPVTTDASGIATASVLSQSDADALCTYSVSEITQAGYEVAMNPVPLDLDLSPAVSFTNTKVAVNLPPVALDDTDNTDVDTAVTTEVLLNDSDPEGGTLTLTAVSGTSAEGGTVSCSATACTYTPPAGFTGVDSYSYKICDDAGQCEYATVVVVVGEGEVAPIDLETLGCGAAVAQAGTSVVLTLPGYLPGTPYVVEINPIIATGTVPAGNSFAVVAEIPASLAPGSYTITATGTGLDGGKRVLTCPKTITAPPTTSSTSVSTVTTSTTAGVGGQGQNYDGHGRRDHDVRGSSGSSGYVQVEQNVTTAGRPVIREATTVAGETQVRAVTAQPSASRTVAFTGSATEIFLAVGGLMLLAGALLIAGKNRKRTA